MRDDIWRVGINRTNPCSWNVYWFTWIGRILTRCKQCQQEYKRKYYQIPKNRIRQIAKAKENKRIAREYIVSCKIKCIQCGEDHLATLDFHHRDPTKKEANIAMITSLDLAIREIKKCDVLCANCHRALHYKQRIAMEI